MLDRKYLAVRPGNTNHYNRHCTVTATTATTATATAITSHHRWHNQP